MGLGHEQATTEYSGLQQTDMTKSVMWGKRTLNRKATTVALEKRVVRDSKCIAKSNRTIDALLIGPEGEDRECLK